MSYFIKMFKKATFEFDIEKNKLLKETRNISFEEIIALMDDVHVLDIVEHPNKEKYNNQKIFVMKIANYIYLVPFVKNGKKLFLKTIIPSRKAKKEYAKGVKNE